MWKKIFFVGSRNSGPAQRRILLLQYCKPPEHKRTLFLVIRCFCFKWERRYLELLQNPARLSFTLLVLAAKHKTRNANLSQCINLIFWQHTPESIKSKIICQCQCFSFAALQDSDWLSRCSDNYSDLYICHCNMERLGERQKEQA